MPPPISHSPFGEPPLQIPPELTQVPNLHSTTSSLEEGMQAPSHLLSHSLVKNCWQSSPFFDLMQVDTLSNAETNPSSPKIIFPAKAITSTNNPHSFSPFSFSLISSNPKLDS